MTSWVPVPTPYNGTRRDETILLLGDDSKDNDG
jgi:hypothetical protein